MFESFTERTSFSLFWLWLKRLSSQPYSLFLILELILRLQFRSEPGWASLNLVSWKFFCVGNHSVMTLGNLKGWSLAMRRTRPRLSHCYRAPPAFSHDRSLVCVRASRTSCQRRRQQENDAAIAWLLTRNGSCSGIYTCTTIKHDGDGGPASHPFGNQHKARWHPVNSWKEALTRGQCVVNRCYSRTALPGTEPQISSSPEMWNESRR